MQITRPAQLVLEDGTVFAGSAVGRPWYNSNKRHFAPNVGLAWDPTGEGKWVVRAGYAFAYVNDNIIRAAENLSEMEP